MVTMLQAFGLMLPLGGCLLSGDKPEPGLDIRQSYDGGPKNPATAEAALPPLDWWREFPLARTDRAHRRGARQQSRHRRGGRPHRAGRRAGAHYRRAAAAADHGQRQRVAMRRPRRRRARPRHRRADRLGSGGSSNTQQSARRRSPPATKSTSGARTAPRCAPPRRLRSPAATTARWSASTTVVARRQRLFPGAGRAGPAAHRARKHGQRDPHPQSDQAAFAGRHRFRARDRAAGEPGQHTARGRSRRWSKRCGRTAPRSRFLMGRSPEQVRVRGGSMRGSPFRA